MNNPQDKEMAALRRLIEREAQAGLERFRRRDFAATLERTLREDQPAPLAAWRRNPLLVPLGLVAVLLLGIGILMIPSYLQTKRDLRQLRTILMRLPELRAPLPALAPAQPAGEEEQLILLSWIFKLAGERLNPGALSAATWRSRIEGGLAAHAVPETPPFRFRELAGDDLLLLEKRIRRFIAAGELQRRRERNKMNRL